MIGHGHIVKMHLFCFNTGRFLCSTSGQRPNNKLTVINEDSTKITLGQVFFVLKCCHNGDLIYLSHPSHKGDLLLWVGFRRRPSFVMCLQLLGQFLLKFLWSYRRRRQEIVHFMTFIEQTVCAKRDNCTMITGVRHDVFVF